MRPEFQAADEDKNGILSLEELQKKVLNFVDLRMTRSVMVEPVVQGGGVAESEEDDGQPRIVPRAQAEAIAGPEGNPDRGYDQRVILRADNEVMPRLDRDHDGHISAEESEGSDWDPPFADSDLDRDGRLSRGELYERYAKKMNLPPWSAGDDSAYRVPGGPMHGPAQLPADMEVRVTKKGNRPAVVKVTQGKKSWKTTEDELGMLPPPAQAYARRLLGGPESHMPGMPGMMPRGMRPGAAPNMPRQPGAGAEPKDSSLPKFDLEVDIEQLRELIRRREQDDLRSRPGSARRQ